LSKIHTLDELCQKAGKSVDLAVAELTIITEQKTHLEISFKKNYEN
jgi:hypothetical protein